MDQVFQSSRLQEPSYVSKFFAWITKFNPKRGEEGKRCFEDACDTPPISTNTLSGLDIESIVTCSRARHQINFGLELRCSPKLRGDQGPKSDKCADDYWWALETELEIYSFLLNSNAGSDFRWSHLWIKEFRKQQKRIPKVFTAIQDLLLAMVPPNDRSGVREMFDVHFIMQQIERGSINLASLATWLSELLKAHCAPVRDAWVDQMSRHLSGDAQDFDAKITVAGLRMLFGVLQAIKLDIVNHQIRHLGPVLLCSNLHFELIYNEREILARRVDIQTALQWYSQQLEGTFSNTTTNPHLLRFTRCLVRGLLYNSLQGYHGMIGLPQTFRADYERLVGIRNHVFWTIEEDIYVSRLKHLMHRLGRSESDTKEAIENFRRILPVISRHSSWEDSTQHVAAEIARIATTCSLSCQCANNLEIGRLAEESSFDWHGLYAESGDWVRANLHRGSTVYRDQLDVVEANLVQGVFRLAEQRAHMNPMQIWQSFKQKPLTSRAHSSSSNQAFLQGSYCRTPKFDFICHRIAHIALIHWNAWAPILYQASFINGVTFAFDERDPVRD